MAILNLEPHSEYVTRETRRALNNADGQSYDRWEWHSWGNYTSQNTIDDDANAFYMAQMWYAAHADGDIYWDWSCRLSFTIPANAVITKTNKLVVKIKPAGIWNGTNQPKICHVRYPEVILSAKNFTSPNPQTVYDDSASHISMSYFYQDEAKTKTWDRIQAVKDGAVNPDGMLASGKYVYFVFDTFSQNLTPNTTYYIYFIPWYSVAGTDGRKIDYDGQYFRACNNSSDLSISLNYEATYPITYNANGGSGTMSAGVKTHGTDFVLPANGFTAPATTSAKYTITLDGNGGTSPTAKTCTRTTTRSFAGWALNSANGTVYNAGAKYTTNAAATFYAKWNSSTSGGVILGNTTRDDGRSVGYKITYNGNGGVCSVAYESVTNITKYTFLSWNSAKSGSGTAYNNTTNYPFNANTTLYAQWSSETIKGSTHLPVAGECMKAGYTLIGWATTSSATEPDYLPGATYTPSRAVTLYAVWSPNTYTVTYNANGGSGTMADSDVVYNTPFLTRQNTFTHEGYKFNGWNEAADGTGTPWTLKSLGVYEHGISWVWTYTQNITLYAQWSYAARTLIVNPNGGIWNGTADNSSITQDYNTTLTIANPTRIGYTFDGWTISGGGSFANKIYTFGAEDGTLTASWSPNEYTVMFDGNGGSGTIASINYVYDNNYNLPTNTFTRKGYHFLGWSINKNATSATYEDGATVSNLATSGTIILYAVWEGYDYVVQYNANNGHIHLSISSHKVGTTSQLSQLMFTYEGHTFLGWATSADGTPLYANGAIAPEELVTTDNETINLYAIWSAKSPWTLCSIGFFAPTSATDSTLKWWTI